MYIFEEISQLTHAELFDLLVKYDKYVKEICDRKDGSVPACVAEFFQNDYPLIEKE